MLYSIARNTLSLGVSKVGVKPFNMSDFGILQDLIPLECNIFLSDDSILEPEVAKKQSRFNVSGRWIVGHAQYLYVLSDVANELVVINSNREEQVIKFLGGGAYRVETGGGMLLPCFRTA